MLRDITPFLDATLSKHQKNLYQLGWINLYDNDLGMTDAGRIAYIRCMVLFDGDFVAYAKKEVAKIALKLAQV